MLSKTFNPYFLKLLTLFALFTTLFPLAIVSISLGVYNIPFDKVLNILFHRNIDQADTAYVIVWQYRVPRTIAAIVAGAVFALAGAFVQGATRNPLASPFTLGISTAASFGAALAIIAGVKVFGFPQTFFSGYMGYTVVSLSAFALSVAQTFIVLALSLYKGMSPESIVLAGIASAYIYSAGITILEYFAGEWSLREYVYWVIGDLVRVDWQKLWVITAIFAVCIALIFFLAWDLNTLYLGDEVAKSLGVDPVKTRVKVLIVASIATAIVVSVTGPIPFICLMAPHIARIVVGSDNRYLLPASIALGAALLLASDTIARVVLKPVELPVGAVTSALGAAFFLSLYMFRRRAVVMGQ